MGEKKATARKNGHRSPEPRPRPRPPRQRHWLDRRAPAAAEWLDSQARELWLRGLEERCKSFPELTGHELLLRRLVSERAEALARALSLRFPERDEDPEDGEGGEPTPPTNSTTSRARTHLQAAALVRATGDALLPFFRGDEQRVLEVLRDSTGRGSSRLGGLLAATLRLQARLEPFVPTGLLSILSLGGGKRGMGMAERRLRLLREDHGGAWPGAEVAVVAEGEEEEDGSGGKGRTGTESLFALLVPSFLRGSSSSGPSASSDSDLVTLKTTTSTLRVPRCLYYEMMTMATSDDGGEERGGGGNDGGGGGGNNSPCPSSSPPRWLEACCCSVDGVWFEPWESNSGSSSGGSGGPLSALATRGSSLREPLVSFRRRRWLGEFARACELCVTRVEAR